MKPLNLHVPDLTEDEEAKAAFLKSWGTGWRLGYHNKPAAKCVCPFDDHWCRKWFNDGVLAGATAREKLQPWAEDVETPITENVEDEVAA